MTRVELEQGGETMQVRPLNQDKYNISKYRFRELYYFCLQYHEWQDELKYNTDTVGAICYDGLPHGSNISDQTGNLGARRAELARRCEIIEQTAVEADPEIYQYILRAVTDEHITYKYLKTVMGIPCGKDMYYDRRRKFYWLLSRKFF